MYRRARVFRLAVPAAALVLTAGCEKGGKELEKAADGVLREMSEGLAVASGLGGEFDVDTVAMRVGEGGRLTVVFANAELARAPEAERRAASRRAAVYVRDHYVDYAEVTAVTVVWLAGPYDSDTFVAPRGSHTFTRVELGTPRPRPRSDADTIPPPTWRDLFPMEPVEP